MGYTSESITISVTLSRHNSDQDRQDNADWQELQERIEMIVREHRYEGISAMVV